MDKLHGLFPGLDIGDTDDEDHVLFDASQAVNDSVQASY